MDSLEIIFWARAIERLLIVLFGGASLFLGWNLFRTGVLDPQAGEFEIQGWKANLRNAGPGTFFALFGTAILVWSMATVLSLSYPGQPTLTSPQSNDGQHGGNVSWALGSPESGDLAKAINTIIDYRVDFNDPFFNSPTSEKLVQEAVNILEEHRNRLVIAQFGKDAYNTYLSNIESYTKSPVSVGVDERETIEEILPWVEGTLAN